MLRWRLLLGTVFVVGLAALAWLEVRTALPIPPLFLLALLLSVVASSEVIWLLAAQNLRPLRGIIYVGNFLIVASNGIPLFWPNYPPDCPLGSLGWPLSTFTVLVLVCFLGEMRRYEKPGGVMVQLALAVFALAYVGLLLSYVVQLRMVVNREVGLVALVSLILVVKMGDTGAYTAGRVFGRHKMAPVLSPSKTLEGAVGGAAFAILGSWAVLTLLAPQMLGRDDIQVPWWTWAAYGLVVGLAGMVGDLAESLFKRDMGRKDSSSWMPGFGGALDLLDSILFAAPVAYLCWISGLMPV